MNNRGFSKATIVIMFLLLCTDMVLHRRRMDRISNELDSIKSQLFIIDEDLMSTSVNADIALKMHKYYFEDVEVVEEYQTFDDMYYNFKESLENGPE